ncbi:hypothetical protein G9C98_004661, partial [Cotesia typhae]
MDINNFSFEKVEIKLENYDEDPLDNETADNYKYQQIVEESAVDVEKVKIEPVHSTFPHENIYVEPDRQDLRSYLEQSFKGLLILNYYKLHNTLTDSLSNYLAEMAIGREIYNILKRENTTIENPLKKLMVPTVILKNLASEISQLFNEKSGIYYSPGFTDGTKKINASGKLQSQLNYVRRLLIDSGLLVISSRRSSVLNDSTDLGSATSLLNLLKKDTEDLEKIEKSWIDTFGARQQLIADSPDKLVEFSSYPCLSGDKATHFITLDFERKFKNVKSLKTSWPDFRETFQDFILSKRIDDVDAALQVAKLSELVDDEKDAVIISLLPLAIKSSTPSTAKRRKVEKFIKVEVENLDKPETSSSDGCKIKEETSTIEFDTLSSYSFKCDMCRKEFIKKSTLRYHMRLHIEEKPYSSSEFPANKSKNKPPIIQKRAKPYACSECPSRFRAKRTLDNHMLLHTGERPYLCTLCPATFRVSHNLKHHMKSHRKDKAFNCSACSKTFREQSLVENHIKTHSEDKPVAYKACSCKSSHTENKPIACDLCPYKFRTNGDLKYHMRIHTGEKPFQCDECSAKFCRKSQLAEHKRTHSGEKPFECKSCSFKCARKSQLNYHVKNYHKKGSYSCKECPSICDDVVALKIHAGHHKKAQVE